MQYPNPISCMSHVSQPNKSEEQKFTTPSEIMTYVPSQSLSKHLQHDFFLHMIQP